MAKKEKKITGIPFDIVLFVLFLFFTIMALAYLLLAAAAQNK
jgi:hypothetical protein